MQGSRTEDDELQRLIFTGCVRQDVIVQEVTGKQVMNVTIQSENLQEFGFFFGLLS